MSTSTSDFLRHLRTLTARQAIGNFSDQQLLECFRLERSEASFAVLVQRHGPMVLSVCRRVLHNVQDVEDSFQATFLVLAKKAAMLRQPPLLSGWLHGVAYHVALRLKAKTQRRTAHEHRVDPPPPGDAMDDITWRELRSVLDEELQRLPEKYRAPLVLCYLEAQTQDEAARHLGWSKNTFGRRINQARQMLARRLTRRGLTAPAVLTAPLLIDGAAPAAVPPLLAASTVRTGVALASGQSIGDLASASVAALVERGGKTLLASKGKWTLALMLAVSAATGSALTHQTLASRPVETQPAASPASPLGKSQQEAAIVEKGDTITISGRVLDPDGKPFSGAKIYLIGSGDRPKKHAVRAVSGPAGRFHFTFPKSEYFEAGWIRERAEMWRWCDIVAAASDYSPVNVYIAGIKNELVLRLVKDVRIDGRVRDLEGRPVERAEVRVIGSSWSSLVNPVTTDKEGRFGLSGVGRGREEELRISAPALETQWIKVKTPSEGPAKVEVLAAPTKPVEGTIRGRDTGKPLAGVEVWAKLDGRPRGEDEPHLLRTATDGQGRYRLLGLPKRPLYELTVVPPVEQGYVVTAKQAEDSEGLKPIRLDFELTRGAIVRFRLIDKETGLPVRGNAQYSPLIDNPFWAEATHLEPGSFPPRVFFYYHDTEKDGFIQFAAYPGPGVIYAAPGWGNRPYLNARLDPKDEKNGHFPGMKGDELNMFLQISPGYRRIDPKPTDRQLAFNIVFDPGRTLKGTLIDLAGQPVRAATAWGLGLGGTPTGTVRQGEKILETAEFTATGIERDKPCTLSFVHRGRKLIGQKTVHPEDNGPLTVHLQSWGALTGRLVTAEGKPLADVKMRLRYPDSPDSGMRPPELPFATDREGRFRVEGLLSDRDHELILGHGPKKLEHDGPKMNATLPADDVLKKAKTHAGETMELGDIIGKPSDRPAKK